MHSRRHIVDSIIHNYNIVIAKIIKTSHAITSNNIPNQSTSTYARHHLTYFALLLNISPPAHF